MNDGPVLQIEDLIVSYRVGANALRSGSRSRRDVVKSVSLDVAHNEIVGLVGESGSGKTSVARAVLGLVRATSGSIKFLGDELIGRRGQVRNDPKIQMVFQDPLHSLDPTMTIRRILAEPMLISGVVPREQIDEVCLALMETMDLKPAILDRRPHEISGGQRQRVGLARALSTNPQLIVADEATSALDVTVQAHVLNLMMGLRANSGVSFLFISHNLGVIRHVADRVAVMKGGEIVEHGPATTVFDNPQHPYTQQLIASVPAFG